LYAIVFSPPYTLVQFDLTAPNIPAAFTDIVTIMPGLQGEGLMVARDCKMYMAKAGTHYLDVINYPDVPGTGCGYLANAVYLGNQLCKYELPNNIDGLFANLCNGVSVPELSADLQFHLYPVPAGNFLFIETSYTKSFHIIITDVAGKQVSTKTFSDVNLQKELSVKSFSPGIYFIRILTQDGMKVIKFVKE
jgi:hypothetical protein